MTEQKAWELRRVLAASGAKSDAVDVQIVIAEATIEIARALTELVNEVGRLADGTYDIERALRGFDNG